MSRQKHTDFQRVVQTASRMRNRRGNRARSGTAQDGLKRIKTDWNGLKPSESEQIGFELF